MHCQYLKLLSQPIGCAKKPTDTIKKLETILKKNFTVLDGMQWRQNWLWWLALGTTMQRKLRKD